MKRIDAVIRVHRLEPVVRRLLLVGATGLTVSEVRGDLAGQAIEGIHHGQRYRIESAPRYQVTVVVPDDLVATMARAIVHSARTEERGDGIIAVSDVEEVVRIRTGERGIGAL